MKRNYLTPAIIGAEVVEMSSLDSKNAIPAAIVGGLAAVAAAATSGYMAGKQLKKVFGVMDYFKMNGLTPRKIAIS